MKGSTNRNLPNLHPKQQAALDNVDPNDFVPNVSAFKDKWYNFEGAGPGKLSTMVPISHSRSLLGKALLRLTNNSNATLTGYNTKRKFDIVLAMAELLPGFPLADHFIENAQREFPNRAEQSKSMFILMKNTIAPQITEGQWDQALDIMEVDVTKTNYPAHQGLSAGSAGASSTGRPAEVSDKDAVIAELQARLAAVNKSPALGKKEKTTPKPSNSKAIHAKFLAMVQGSPSPSKTNRALSFKVNKILDKEAQCIPDECDASMTPLEIDEIVMKHMVAIKTVNEMISMFPKTFKLTGQIDFDKPKSTIASLAQLWRQHVFQKVLYRDPPTLEGDKEDDDVVEVVSDTTSGDKSSNTSVSKKRMLLRTSSPILPLPLGIAFDNNINTTSLSCTYNNVTGRKSVGDDPEIKVEDEATPAPAKKARAASTTKKPPTRPKRNAAKK